MKNKFKSVIVIVMVIVTLGIFAATAAPALAQDYGLGATAKETGLKNVALPTFIGSIIGIALSMIGILFLAMIIYGGYMWMTSFGDTQKVTKAKELITGAVIGLVIILAAYAITNFVIGALVPTTPTPPK